ncbi:hypothetical protein BX661DRAFT_60848 [Kickxella alabastrina]|uniref:uncharacterized protein n=1 Tax=Kickxella alabastrina TaxID=61397 RepID=UPI00221EDC42|nr:uncharacterized protein BX661DRAFT_60848 [Kickxella alabastrina]KAI7822281.1 hypothetical protein BX661DRAFT_60848 [Kickxella alabastrina]
MTWSCSFKRSTFTLARRMAPMLPLLFTLLISSMWVAITSASPVPQEEASPSIVTVLGAPPPTTSIFLEATSPPDTTPTETSNNGVQRKISIYYILIICACVLVALIFFGTIMQRMRIRNRNAARELEQRRIGAFSGAEQQQQLQGNGRKDLFVLSQSQFDLLPHNIARGPLLDAKNDDASDNDAQHIDGKTNSKDVLQEKLFDKEPESCSICLSDVASGDKLVYLVPCLHAFHVDCAGPWLMKKSTLCPLCKADVVKGLGILATQSDNNDNVEVSDNFEVNASTEANVGADAETVTEVVSVPGSGLQLVNVPYRWTESDAALPQARRSRGSSEFQRELAIPAFPARVQVLVSPIFYSQL